MIFWQYQEQIKKSTRKLIGYFFLLNVVSASLAELLWRLGSSSEHDYYVIDDFPYVAFAFLVTTFAVAILNYINYKAAGPSHIAETMGGYIVDESTKCRASKILLNVCEEISIASQMKMPKIYIIPDDSINAFAVGTDETNYIIAVNSGTLKKLTREEVQGVVAHEFGHLKNNDVSLSMKLTCSLMGLSFLTYIGFRFIEMFLRGFRFSDNKNKKHRGDGFLLIGGAIAVAGVVGSIFGLILRSTISRKREFLADATAVEFTRSTTGLANALKKIAQENSSPPLSSFVYSHLFFNNNDLFSCIFATHPPIEERIKVLENQDFYMQRSSDNFKIH